jgi:hypothetical protein
MVDAIDTPNRIEAAIGKWQRRGRIDTLKVRAIGQATLACE